MGGLEESDVLSLSHSHTLSHLTHTHTICNWFDYCSLTFSSQPTSGFRRTSWTLTPASGMSHDTDSGHMFSSGRSSVWCLFCCWSLTEARLHHTRIRIM